MRLKELQHQRNLTKAEEKVKYLQGVVETSEENVSNLEEKLVEINKVSYIHCNGFITTKKMYTIIT